MASKFNEYQELNYPLPEKTLMWNMYGAGLENIGVDGEPETGQVPEPADDQLLVRVDSVGMCFSDVKLIKQGRNHPKLYNRDLKKKPTRLGHEAAWTVIKVGEKLADRYYPGQRLVVQPDIYQNNISTAYGYTIPGGLIQYHLVGDEILDADAGAYVIPVEGDLSYAESALTEPWACVVAAYTQRRRLSPKQGGTMWIFGQPGDERDYEFSEFVDVPGTIVLSDVPDGVRDLVEKNASQDTKIIEVNDLNPVDFASLNADICDGKGFDDIICLSSTSADVVSEAVKLIAFRGTFNIIADEPLHGDVQIDAGRIHYHYTAYLGNPGPDIAASYGDVRNRCDLKNGGTLIVVGAGGPMGQMHVQRAIEMNGGPKRIIASDINEKRLLELRSITQAIAEDHNKEIFFFNPATPGQSFANFLKNLNEGKLADDVVVCVPSGPLMQSSFDLLGPDGMFVLFAGVPIGVTISIDISHIFMNNQQLTGTSGSSLDDQKMVIEKTVENQLSPILSVAAVGGMGAALDGLKAMMSGKYPGKVVIFPQVTDLPLVGLDKLAEQYPEIGKKLGKNNAWTYEAEKELIKKFWKPENV